MNVLIILILFLFLSDKLTLHIFFSLFYLFLHLLCIFMILLFLVYFCMFLFLDHSRVMIQCIFFQALTISILRIHHRIHSFYILFKIQLLLLFNLFFCFFMPIRHNLINTVNTCFIYSRL